MNLWLTIIMFLAAATVACGHKEANQEDPNVKILAHAVSYGLTKSPVSKNSIPFAVVKPYAMFKRVGLKLLKLAKVNKPELADEAGAAAEKVYEKLGKLTSELYIRTVGFEVAKFLNSSGLLTDANLVYFAFMVVTAIELEVCIIGANDAESFTTAVVYGLFHTFNALGMVGSGSMTKLFNVFSKELILQAGICQCQCPKV